ncbi:hypothetical protein [Paraburkholderia sediminicola]|uniref:hypothetical protein n=1 Tax=Paraburkholderia sediminicola TaxID=458836 RepID=UPI0038B807CF
MSLRVAKAVTYGKNDATGRATASVWKAAVDGDSQGIQLTRKTLITKAEALSNRSH